MKFLTLVFALLIFGDVTAQDYTFKVLINKGQNHIRVGSDWRPIKVGASMKSGDELKVAPNGYLGLVHVSGKPLEVKEAGQHKVVELAAKVKGGSSVLNKYTDFILSSKADGNTNLTATGAVKRGTGDIKVYLPQPQQCVVFNDEISFAWAKEPKTKTYVVQFNSMFGDELDRVEVQDTTFSIKLNGSRFANEDNIIVKVGSKHDSKIVSADFVLKKLSDADKKRVNTALADMAEISKEKNALNMLYLASFYEDNSLLIDASSAYLEAIKLSPQIPDYLAAYRQFVARHSLRN